MKIGWYSDLTALERRTYWACFGGFALDSMDTTIYALVMPVLIAVVGITRPEAGVLASAALIGSAVGGWTAGILADRIGRVRVLQMTILWCAATTLVAAFCSHFGEFMVVRFAQGLGYGGEAAVGGVLISEVVRPALRGRVAASVQAGYALGFAVSTALMPVFLNMFPPAIGWRVFFGFGVTPALFIFFIRRLVPESVVFTDAMARRKKGEEAEAFWRIFAGPHLRNTVTAAIMSTGIFGGAYVMITWLPTYLRMSLGLPVTQTAGYLALNIIGSLTGPFIYGYVSDAIGRRYAFMLFLVLQAINVGIFLLAPIGPSATIVMSYFLGAFQGGLAAGMLPTFSELFPTALRAGGQGFCLSGGRGFGSVVPAMVGVLSATVPLGTAMGGCALVSYAVAFVAASMMRETIGVNLAEQK
jgi:MFS family permease